MAKVLLTYMVCLSVLFIVGCGESGPLTGSWSGEYQDTRLLVLILVAKGLSGEKITERDILDNRDLITTYKIKLQLKQDKDEVLGSITINDVQTSAIENGSFIGNVLSFTYTKGGIFSGAETINVGGVLENQKTLRGQWGDRGAWKATKQ